MVSSGHFHRLQSLQLECLDLGSDETNVPMFGTGDSSSLECHRSKDVSLLRSVFGVDFVRRYAEISALTCLTCLWEAADSIAATSSVADRDIQRRGIFFGIFFLLFFWSWLLLASWLLWLLRSWLLVAPGGSWWLRWLLLASGASAASVASIGFHWRLWLLCLLAPMAHLSSIDQSISEACSPGACCALETHLSILYLYLYLYLYLLI